MTEAVGIRPQTTPDERARVSQSRRRSGTERGRVSVTTKWPVPRADAMAWLSADRAADADGAGARQAHRALRLYRLDRVGVAVIGVKDFPARDGSDRIGRCATSKPRTPHALSPSVPPQSRGAKGSTTVRRHRMGLRPWGSAALPSPTALHTQSCDRPSASTADGILRNGKSVRWAV